MCIMLVSSSHSTNSSWVVQPVKKCIKHYTQKKSHILWMFAVHHNFVVTFPQHKFKKNHTHTYTHTDPYIETHSSSHTPSRVQWVGLNSMRHEVGDPILRVVHHLQGLMPLAGETNQRIHHQIHKSYYLLSIDKVQTYVTLTGISSHNLQTIPRDKIYSIYFTDEKTNSMSLSRVCSGSHSKWLNQNLIPGLYESKAVDFFIILFCIFVKKSCTDLNFLSPPLQDFRFGQFQWVSFGKC